VGPFRIGTLTVTRKLLFGDSHELHGRVACTAAGETRHERSRDVQQGGGSMRIQVEKPVAFCKQSEGNSR
jgi:hypothetical protein